MLYKRENFTDLVARMKSFGNFLVPYSYPQRSIEDDNDISVLKTQNAMVDGYNLTLFYSKANYNEHFLEVVQVSARYTAFLPFFLVCKIGKKFLGDKHLSYIDFYRDYRKIYCWNVFTNKEGEAISPIYDREVSENTYEDLNYKLLNYDDVKFY